MIRDRMLERVSGVLERVSGVLERDPDAIEMVVVLATTMPSVISVVLLRLLLVLPFALLDNRRQECIDHRCSAG